MVTWLRYAVILGLGLGIGWLAASSHVEVPSTLPPFRASTQQNFVPPAHKPAPAFDPGDPVPSTLEEILRNPSDYEQTAALYNLGLNASREQLEALLAEAAGLSQVSERRAATSILYGRYAELDPESAVEHILRHGGVFADRWLNSVFHTWSRQDLQAAIDRLSDLPTHLKPAAGSALLNARDDLSAQERYEIAQRLGIENVMQQLESQRQIATTDTDPQEAWQVALATENRQYRMQRLYGVAAAWANTDPLGAMHTIATLSDPSLKMGLQQQIVRLWAQRDPRQAIDWVFAQAPSSGRADMLAAALGTLAATEPHNAIGLADNLVGRERERVLASVMQGWASSDPRAAIEWFQFAQDTLPANVAVSVSAVYATQYPDEAFEWAISLPPAESASASIMVLSVIGQSDRDHAAELALSIPDATTRNNAIRNLVQNWSDSDPNAAGQWISEVDDENQRKRLYSSLLQRWSRYDRDAAVSFAERLPSSSDRDAAIVGIISGTRDDLRLAEQLYGRIESEDQRRDAARRLYLSLRRSDPPRAEQYRIAAGLDVEEPRTN